MKNFYLLISFFAFTLLVACQPSTQKEKSKTEGSQDSTASSKDTTKAVTKKMTPAEELLAKSIKFHDPEGNWAKFNTQLNLASERPNGPTRTRLVTINNTDGSFLMKTNRDSLEIEQGIANDSCFAKINGSAKLDTTQQKKYRLDAKRTRFMRNYFVYLYGLPMKLQDKGTVIDENVTKTKFQGKEYLSIKVTYEANVGKDTWYFYFDPATYALSGYRFYHKEEENDGEYITLEGLETVQGIKIPKVRTWYYNKDDKLLGADILNPASR